MAEPISVAIQAGMRNTASMTSSETTGIRATRQVSVRLPSGSSTWVNMVSPRMAGAIGWSRYGSCCDQASTGRGSGSTAGRRLPARRQRGHTTLPASSMRSASQLMTAFQRDSPAPAAPPGLLPGESMDSFHGAALAPRRRHCGTRAANRGGMWQQRRGGVRTARLKCRLRRFLRPRGGGSLLAP